MPVRVVGERWRQTQQNTGQKWKALKCYRIVYKIFGRTNLHTQLIQKYHNRNPKNPSCMSWAMPASSTVAAAQYVNRYARSLFLCFLSVSFCKCTRVCWIERERERARVFGANTIQAWWTLNNVLGRRIFDRRVVARPPPINSPKLELLLKFSTSFLAWMANRPNA